jgi:hypothetical protein
MKRRGHSNDIIIKSALFDREMQGGLMGLDLPARTTIVIGQCCLHDCTMYQYFDKFALR